MTTPAITPLDAWICRKIGMGNDCRLDRDRLERYQLDAVNRTLAHVRRHSPFYRQHLRRLSPEPLPSLDGLGSIPLTSADDLRRDPHALLCVSQSRIARAVTIDTSGTTGQPKRLFFTDADQELTVDFFHHGMATLVTPGQRVLILMPGDVPGSVGDLLVKALARMAVTGIVHGPVARPEAAIEAVRRERINCLVGIPVQVLNLACHPQGRGLAGQIDGVLLSTDYVPDAIVHRLQREWGCRVFKHYGMTEMGLGGAVECAAHVGYHCREADLLVEVVDPQSGLPVADGTAGEIVFTTLTRHGMPLIRYRSGDLAAFRVDSCPCGTLLKTLDAVKGRLAGVLTLRNGECLGTGDLDEALFGVDGVVNYQAVVNGQGGAERLTLRVETQPTSGMGDLVDPIGRAVRSLPSIRMALEYRSLTVVVIPMDRPVTASTGTAKRTIVDQR
jgi:phenylacetate-coenzyme A ligase PaaK-like adenylate-forming protein